MNIKEDPAVPVGLKHAWELTEAEVRAIVGGTAATTTKCNQLTGGGNLKSGNIDFTHDY